jgi:uncharacterized protein (DUF302 family)
MTHGPPPLTFDIGEPHQVALRMVRRALAQQGLRVPAELDISARIRQELGAGVAPCTVLYVDNPALLLESIVFNRGTPLLIPQPIVVTGDGRHSEVLVRSSEWLTTETPESVRDPVRDLHLRITRALDTIAIRQREYLTVDS